jgi:hypothetical protein
MVALGLALVGLSIVVPTSISVIFEHCATFSFIIALAVARAGIWRANAAWLGHSLRDAGKRIAGLTGIAALSGLIGLYARGVAGRSCRAGGAVGVAAHHVAFGRGDRGPGGC